MAIKMKRGTTESWALGPELVDFSRSVTKDKDSVIRAEGVELEMYVYTESANEWYTRNPSAGNAETDGKIPGLPIAFGIDLNKYNPNNTYQLKIMFDGPADCTLEHIWESGILERPDYSTGPWIHVGDDFASGNIMGFVKWPAEKVGAVKPVPIKIKASFREVGAYEELEEGQLGLEYTKDGDVKAKAGIPGVSKWNELPYINIQADWNAADESYPEAIKNKPFGHIISTGEIVNSYTSCSEPMEGAGVVIGGYNPTKMQPNTPYDIWLNGGYLGTHTSDEYANVHVDGIVGLQSGTLVIYGTSAPGNYHILVYGSVETDKKIDSIYLNTYGDLYKGEPNDPASCQVVRNLASDLGGSIASLSEWAKIVNQDLSSLDEALDRIIEIQEQLMAPPALLIAFAVSDTVYRAETGMTWEEWCASEFNTDGFYCEGNKVFAPTNNAIGLNNGAGVQEDTPTTIIISGQNYEEA